MNFRSLVSFFWIILVLNLQTSAKLYLKGDEQRSFRRHHRSFNWFGRGYTLAFANYVFDAFKNIYLCNTLAGTTIGYRYMLG